MEWETPYQDIDLMVILIIYLFEYNHGYRLWQNKINKGQLALKTNIIKNKY